MCCLTSQLVLENVGCVWNLREFANQLYVGLYGKQENVLAESRMMIPDCRKRLEAALADLKESLAKLEDANEKAGTEIEDARATVSQVENLFSTSSAPESAEASWAYDSLKRSLNV